MRINSPKKWFTCQACEGWKTSSTEWKKACEQWRELWESRGGWEELLKPGKAMLAELDRLREERDEARGVARELFSLALHHGNDQFLERRAKKFYWLREKAE